MARWTFYTPLRQNAELSYFQSFFALARLVQFRLCFDLFYACVHCHLCLSAPVSVRKVSSGKASGKEKCPKVVTELKITCSVSWATLLRTLGSLARL